MEFDPVLDGHAPSTFAFVDPTGLSTCDWTPKGARPAPWQDLYGRMAKNRGSVFVCPPEWVMTPGVFRSHCSTASGAIAPLNLSLLGTGAVASLACTGLALNEAQHGAALAFMLIAIAIISMLAGHFISTRHSRDVLAARNLDQVVEVTDPTRNLRSLAAMTTDELVDTMGGTPQSARSELYEMARSEASGPGIIDAADALPRYLSSPSPARPTAAQRWTEAREQFEAVEVAWEAIICDPLAALDHAALLDVTITRTGTFVEHLDDTKHLLRRLGDHVPDAQTDLVEFETAVRRTASAWAEAKRHAAHLDIESLPAHERPHADRARKALALMLDEDATDGERLNAAREVEKALARVKSVILPDRARGVIENVKRLAIEAAPA